MENQVVLPTGRAGQYPAGRALRAQGEDQADRLAAPPGGTWASSARGLCFELGVNFGENAGPAEVAAV